MDTNITNEAKTKMKVKPPFNSLPSALQAAIIEDTHFEYDPYEGSQEECVQRALFGNSYAQESLTLANRYEQMDMAELIVLSKQIASNLQNTLAEMSEFLATN